MNAARGLVALLACLGCATGALLACLGCATGALRGPDPVTEDPRAIDREHPAAMAGLGIESEGARMNAIIYVAQGPGPHPVAVLLHGLPGEERNLDLAQALRRAGWNVLFFHYRGAWGSEGRFSFGNALADVHAAVDLATSDDFAGHFRSDASRTALIGHSMGAFLALVAGSALGEVDCVAALSPVNLGRRAGLSADEAHALAERLDTLTAPLHGTSGAALVAEIQREGERFELTKRAPALLGKPVLLVAGTRDRVTPRETNHDPLVAAFASAGGGRTTVRVLEADHAYSGRRIALAREVVDWLGSACSPAPILHVQHHDGASSEDLHRTATATQVCEGIPAGNVSLQVHQRRRDGDEDCFRGHALSLSPSATPNDFPAVILVEEIP